MNANPPAAVGDRTDRDLLRAFADTRDPAAFAELVRRHGPMVLAACRRILGAAPDADDAFQAVFLVLARRAGAVGRPERLAGWLYGVALRVARRARAATAARRTREVPMARLPETPVEPADRDWADARPVIDEEIGRLPERLRTALVLCDLEEVGWKEAAARLGVPFGTLSSRLARARETLRRRLARRGVAPAVGIAALLALAAAEAAVPPDVVAVVTTAAVKPAAGVVSAGAAALAHRELATLFWKKAAVSGLVGAAVVAVIGVGWVATRPAAGPEPSDQERLQGEWQVTAASIGVGNAQIEAQLVGTRMTIQGDRMTYLFAARYTLDTGAEPRRMDILPDEGQGMERGQVIRAVYKLDGDTLLLNVAQQDRPYPVGFDSEQSMMLTYVRVKDRKAE